MKKYLYSLIWFDDPTTSSSDTFVLGSLLQILNSQSFDKLFLWRTHEICQSSNYKLKETRLKEIIKEQFRIPIEIHDLEKEGLNEIGKWKDIFTRSLSLCLQKETPDDVLWYINFSSGTPVMISSLTHAILSINQPLWAVYANEATFPVSKKYEVTKKAIVAALAQSKQSVTTAPIKQLQETAIKEQIKQLLDSKAYHAASLLLGGMSSTYYQTLKAMCDGAYALSMLDVPTAKTYFKYTPLRSLMATQIPQDVMNLIVYTANLQTKIEQKEYFDFVMRTSPLLYELCITIFIEYTHFPQAVITPADTYATQLIKRQHVSMIPPQFKGFFTNFFYKNPSAEFVVLTTPLLIHLISHQLTSSFSMVAELNQLRSFEEKIRNEFAHVFSTYSEHYIKVKTGKTPTEIIHLFKHVIRKVSYDYQIDASIFDLYDTINDTIQHYIEL